MNATTEQEYPINEIFYSLQGEGYHTGRAAVFIRFSGCNLRCPFCDTAHQSHELLPQSEVVRQASQYPARFAVLTGGEPALYVTRGLIQALHDAGFFVAIETNGTRPLPPSIDWVTLSPKSDWQPGADVVLERADEVKVVYTGQDLTPWAAFPAAHHYLQPCHTPDAEQTRRNTAQCVACCKQNPAWRLSLQTHTLIGIQ